MSKSKKKKADMNYKRMIFASILSFSLAVLIGCGSASIEPYGPTPTPAQLEWQKMEMNMFCHFGPNTFTGNEWGDGTEPEDIFAPTSLDCNQWVSVAKQAGMKGIIITAKHHDGFCLWPNPVSTHTVAHSQWRNGKGDVLRELSDACALGGVKFGIYISPWDRNDPAYGTEEYNHKFLETLASAHENYGDIFEQWFDGANGEGPTGIKQVYDWPAFNNAVLSRHPQAVIFSDVGPGCRWVGNEWGCAGRTCWSTLNIDGYEPGRAPCTDTLNQGNRFGSVWVPAETDVSIRPGWFYRPSEHPKTLQQLLTIYYNSVGRNSLLLLNVPPDMRGLIPAEDSVRLVEFREALNSIFGTNLVKGSHINTSFPRKGKLFASKNLLDNDYDTYYASDDGATNDTITIVFPKLIEFNRVVLQEYIPLGQRVDKFHIETLGLDAQWHIVAEETSIGYKRIVMLPNTKAMQMRIVVDKSAACIVLNTVGVYFDRIYQEQ